MFHDFREANVSIKSVGSSSLSASLTFRDSVPQDIVGLAAVL